MEKNSCRLVNADPANQVTSYSKLLALPPVADLVSIMQSVSEETRSALSLDTGEVTNPQRLCTDV